MGKAGEGGQKGQTPSYKGNKNKCALGTQHRPTDYETESVTRSVASDSLQCHGLKPASILCPWDFPSKNTEVGCRFLLQGIFLMQGSNPGLLHARQVLYRLSHRKAQKTTGD